jgi:hypothetical protein
MFKSKKNTYILEQGLSPSNNVRIPRTQYKNNRDKMSLKSKKIGGHIE